MTIGIIGICYSIIGILWSKSSNNVDWILLLSNVSVLIVQLILFSISSRIALKGLDIEIIRPHYS